jgi:hypothetical protein
MSKLKIHPVEFERNNIAALVVSFTAFFNSVEITDADWFIWKISIADWFICAKHKKF